MGKIKFFGIVYENNGVFIAGENVKGQVVLELTKAIRVKKILLLCEGKSKVKWFEGEDAIKAKELYFQKWITVHEPGNLVIESQYGVDDLINPGFHQFEFQFTVAQNSPASFQGEHGHVNYYCEARLEKGGFSNLETTSSGFTMVNHLDLNNEPESIKFEMEGKQRSEVQCCCCIAGDVYAEFKINKQAFVPGENIYINALVKNNSNADVPAVRVTLEQHVTFYGYLNGVFSSRSPKSKFTKNYITAMKHENIENGAAHAWDNVPMEVPMLPPSRLSGSSFIDIGYTVIFKVYVPHGEPIKMGCAITIGTIPLRPFLVVTNQPVSGSQILIRNQPLPSQPLLVPSAQPSSSRSTPSPPPPYAGEIDPETWKLPPPSYEECISGMAPVRQINR